MNRLAVTLIIAAMAISVAFIAAPQQSSAAAAGGCLQTAAWEDTLSSIIGDDTCDDLYLISFSGDDLESVGLKLTSTSRGLEHFVVFSLNTRKVTETSWFKSLSEKRVYLSITVVAPDREMVRQMGEQLYKKDAGVRFDCLITTFLITEREDSISIYIEIVPLSISGPPSVVLG